jgi:MFS transporter, BCD family, chlorophyll transporter
MSSMSRRALNFWFRLGPRFLPFADVATPELPLGRLLRLSLFQVSVGMALVLLIGTLNRVMIVELEVPASIVGIMIALPLVFAPFRAMIGFRSDNYHSALGWRRVPYIWKGTMLQFGGLALMPFALLVLAKQGEAGSAPVWIGWTGAGLSFLLVGAGLHMVQTVGLALATDLAPEESRPKVVGLMYVMLLLGMIGSAFLFGAMLHDFTPGRLIQVIQASALATIILNVIAIWKQETRNTQGRAASVSEPSFREVFAGFLAGDFAVQRLAVIGFGTFGFGMADVLLEPYGGQVLGLTVADTTRLTATLAFGGLAGFAIASHVLARGTDPLRMAAYGAAAGIPAFAAVILAAPLGSGALFAAGTALIGLGAGLFGHGTLTATMNAAPKAQSGLALGAWGAVQASAAGLAIAFGGILRDVIATLGGVRAGNAVPFVAVYTMEIAALAVALGILLPLIARSARRQRAAA